jgi:hypothetical protein
LGSRRWIGIESNRCHKFTRFLQQIGS